MNKLGIIALEDERITKLKWYNFRHYKITEGFYLDNCLVEVLTIYVGKSLKLAHQTLIDNGIIIAVCTERFAERYGEISLDGIEIVYGKNLYRRLVPKIIRKTVKISGMDSKSGTLAISEENPVIALSLVENLCNDFRYITIIAKNKRKACEISEKILNEYGLPIVIADSGSKINCDIAVKTGLDIPNVPKNTILIDASTEHTITRKNTINWAEVSPLQNLPYKIDSLSFAEGIEFITGTSINYKISRFRCGNKSVTTTMLTKKD